MKHLSPRSICVLEMIAEGHSYAQIVEQYPDLTYRDIFGAASEALELSFRSAPEISDTSANERSALWAKRLAELRTKSPRAYERWDAAEDARLVEMHRSGQSAPQIAATLQRQASAIRSRLVKLELGA